jgi:aldose 1-epimerase
MNDQTKVVVTAGALRLQLTPSIGGAISAFERDELPVLRRCPDPLDQVLDAACFPLVPFANRIRGGRFTFRGREVRLTPNMAGDPSPLHGQGWMNPWSAVTESSASATLDYRHEPGEWPWRYAARQEFALDENGLVVTLSCRNLSDEPMPCGLGMHPYFECGSETRIDTKVACVWTVDEHVLPVAKVPATGRYDLHDRAVCGQGLDNGFSDWGGVATITGEPVGTIAMSSPGAHFFQLYSPPAGGIFVAEPVSHANCALNAPEEQWPELGMRVLDCGEEMRLRMRIEVGQP